MALASLTSLHHHRNYRVFVAGQTLSSFNEGGARLGFGVAGEAAVLTVTLALGRIRSSERRTIGLCQP
jgi:hypothetical protein